MSYRIPTLEEARKKQEESLSQSKQRLSTTPSMSHTNSTSLASGVPLPSNLSNNNYNHKSISKTPRSKVANPYLKYKKKKKAAASFEISIPKATSNDISISTNCAHVLPKPNASTFSQAFYAVENSKPSNSKNADESKDWEKQRAIDASILIAQLQNETSSDISKERNKGARDNHALLQPHILHVSTKQRGNRILNHIRNVPFELSKMVPDYIMGPNRCALFLSCKYHKLNPTYIHRRIAELGTDFELRVLLTLVDMEDNASTLLFLNHLCVLNNLTLFLSWSEEEAARYLETFKAFEKKDATLIQKREKETYSEQVADVLSTVRSINKTDSQQLLVQFGNFKNVIGASMDELSLCPGIGTKKVKRLFDAFNLPFSRKSKVDTIKQNETI